MSRYAYIPELYDVRFQAPETSRQSDEYFSADIDGKRKLFNIHDYATLYRVPWLYDVALYHTLACRTPTEMSDAIANVWSQAHVDPAGLRVLELGAGSGAFGYELRHALNVGHLEAIDICPEARLAAERDRAGLYDRYHVDDLTHLRAETKAAFDATQFNVVSVASATGWGNHIPLAGFQTGFNILVSGGWFIFHVKPHDPDPECVQLCLWIDELIRSDHLKQIYRGSHFHRRSSNGTDIFYDVIIGRKV
ncbi:MAG: class I SAM-dependent methyltransferase [Pseudomonadota bacterium]